MYTSCHLVLIASSQCGSLRCLYKAITTRCLLRYAPRWRYLWSWLHRVIKESLSFLKCLFFLLQVEWCCFTRSSAHPLLPYVLFGLLRCPTSRNTAMSHNIDSWFWLCLLSSNKLDVLVYYWLRFSDLSYQGRTFFWCTAGLGSLILAIKICNNYMS